ncbi:hypothetical protein RND81_08G098500 [Saponaria officinalis]|uniref:Uncharacterized protein n=1 Tax=Saponaria officinalis TaxID=3572 RepID=A0AAW1J5Y5_SAPOF
MGGTHEFNVTVTGKSKVAATLPIQEHWLPLSNLDLLLPPLNVHVIFCYKKAENEETDFKQKVSVLKKGLAQALVSFYAFAGELVNNSAGEPEILCNNRGVDFIEAFAEVKLRDLQLYDPAQCFEAKLVPLKGDGVLSVQVTKLECGAITIGCTFDHRVADAYSANMFWVTWSEMTTSKPITTHPCFRRSLLNPKRPLMHDISLDDMYVPISTLTRQNEPKTMIDSDPLISRIYNISADQLRRLQCLASNCSLDCCKGSFMRSKLQSFSAFLWKLVASHAYHFEPDTNGSGFCKMGIVVDGRTRLSDGEGKDKLTRLFSYFGNVLSIPFGEQKCGDLTNMSLDCVTNKVHNFLNQATSKDHFLGLIDWVEAHKPEPLVAKIYSNKTEDGPAFVVSSGQRFPISKVDFGWGKPGFGSYHFPWGGNCGYVMPMPSPLGNGDWVVYMHLRESQLDFIQKKACGVIELVNSNLVGLA